MLAAVRDRRASDPLTAALQPPPDETPSAREARLASEREAKKISDGIDEQLRQEKEARKAKLKGRKQIKVLLLGQSESGKSTTLKQFQLAYTPNAFREERLAWRSVIYLNLVRSVRRIIDALSPVDPSDSPTGSDPADEDEPYVGRPSTSQGSATTSALFSSQPYVELKARLEPLLVLEEKLIKLLAGGDDDEATQLAWPAPPDGAAMSKDRPPTPSNSKSEVSLNTRHNWKRALNKLALGSKNDSSPSELDGWWNDPSDPGHVLDQCRPDLEKLWGDEAVQAELKRKRLRLEESSGFYLDSLPRITSLRYVPSDDDVLKARLKTLGVVEHMFSLETGKERGVDWKIYDVGGARSQRQAWAPYFEDMNALIFLAPISAFDQDPRVNRVEDSLLLWRSVVANKLLSNVNIILFLNKCDLLKAKLEAGVRLNQYMTSYGDRPNDHEAVSKYFRNKFLALNQSYSPNPDREVYLHLTAVTDTRRTSSIISNVRDIILRDDLKGVKLL
ncbi:guanine nucleotide binding protein, alpha subunit [Gautieria morchelliformis]|nr:guanine nucleotide binding protein, alpha subunit [Gautieria morchelliformis]